MLITIVQFILALSLLIVLHEFGHYFFAKLFKTRVEKFYLFFDFLFPFSNILPFSLFKKKVGDTTYGIGWFPLGGYVKIAGMIDESMDNDQMAKPPQPWEFRSKPAWQRLLIMLGGIIVNVITALIIYSLVLYSFGEKKLTMSEVNRQGGIEIVDSLMYDLGFINGDKIISVDGKATHYFLNSFEDIILGKEVTINRNGKDTILKMPVDVIGRLVDKKASFLFTFPIPTIVAELPENSAALLAGVQKEDRIIAVNGVKIPNFFELRRTIKSMPNTDVTIDIQRGTEVLSTNIHVSDSGTLGFVPYNMGIDYLGNIGYYDIEKSEYSLVEAIPAGFNLAYGTLTSYVKQFGKILQPQTGAYKGVGSFISMAKVFGDEFQWERFWRITAFFSLALAFMNLLPIPGLDGGYVMITLYEMIFRRKLPDGIMSTITTAGLIFLMMFMLYAFANDIFRNVLN